MGNKLKKDIFILSASDRFNYGDLLFPIITKKELSKYGDFNFYNIGIVKSNLSKIGAVPSQSYKKLYKYTPKKEKAYLIIAGGEVLGANWSRLLSFIYPSYFKLYNVINQKNILENITQKILGYKDNPFPFIPTSKVLLSKFNVIFHGVGGVGIGEKRNNFNIQHTFQTSLYISARENETYTQLQDNFRFNDTKLTPDPAILMSNYFHFVKENKVKYIAFQIGHYKNGGNLKLINQELQDLSSLTGLPIHFIPTGNCPGHDDIISLRWLYENANYPSKLVYPSSISNIMKAIALSELFIGTSLHGIITAMSYSVPYVALNPKISKITYYLDTWAPLLINHVVDFNQIAKESFSILKSSYSKILNQNSNHQKLVITQSFQRIAEKIINQ